MGGFSFVAPLALVGLASLPLIYWLLRVTPPRPREVVFPPTKILRELRPDEETPARTPWWLLLLRLALAAALILAMAGPVWTPAGTIAASSAPTLLALDDSWAAAPSWERRLSAGTAIIEGAARSGAPVAVMTLSETAAPALADAARALEKLRSARPRPYLPDRRAPADALATFVKANPKARIVWISDALAEGEAGAFAKALKQAADAGARVEILTDDHAPLALAAPANDAATLSVDVLRADASGPGAATVSAFDSKGQIIGQSNVSFGGVVAGEGAARSSGGASQRCEPVASDWREFRRRRCAAGRPLEGAPRRGRGRRRSRRGAALAVAGLLSGTSRWRLSRNCARRGPARSIRSARFWTSAPMSWRLPMSASPRARPMTR